MSLALSCIRALYTETSARKLLPVARVASCRSAYTINSCFSYGNPARCTGMTKPMKRRRVALYARVSTDRQSTENQLRELHPSGRPA